MARDRDALLRNLIAGYGDSIRLSDIKANIAVLFVAIMMGTVLSFRNHYPWYLSVPVLLAPFIVIFLNLLVSVYPRFPRAGRKRFPIWRNSKPEDFEFISDPAPEADDLPDSMRAPVEDPLLEDDYPSGRVPYRHGDDRRCGGAVVRGVALRRERSRAGRSSRIPTTGRRRDQQVR